MRKLKQIGLLVLALCVLLMCMAGCNTTKPNDPDDGSSNQTTTTTSTTGTTTTTTGTTTATGTTTTTTGTATTTTGAPTGNISTPTGGNGKLVFPTTAYETTTAPTTAPADDDDADALDLSKYPEPKKSNTDWFVEAGYGIMVHCTEHTHNIGKADDFFSDGKKTTWDECVNGVDVESFADQVAETGAGYVILCVQQQYQFFATPISHYENLVGFEPGQACSTRDLPLDMMNALAKRDIPFILYFTGDGPWRNNIAFSALSDKSFPNAICNTEWNDTYVENWSKMILELSLRYGEKLVGWYFDGMDRTKFTDDDLYFFAKAAKAGNPNSILAFNGGLGSKYCYTPYEDFSFGEQNDISLLPSGRYITSTDGTWQSQSHVMAYLDGGSSGTMLTASQTITYIQKIMAVQSVVTFDVDMNRYGEIRAEHMDVLREVKAAIRG